MRPDDRTVHGMTVSGERAIVRYERSGTWYVESPDGERVRITVDHAARLAADGTSYPRKPGGTTFDARVRKLRREAADSQPQAEE